MKTIVSEVRVVRLLVWGEKITTFSEPGKDTSILIERSHEIHSSTVYVDGGKLRTKGPMTTAIRAAEKEAAEI